MANTNNTTAATTSAANLMRQNKIAEHPALFKPDCSFEEALVVGLDITKETAAILPSLPRRDASRYLPTTVSDALSLVHAREDAKRKNAGNKVNKAKQKSGVAALFGPDERIPGALQGGGDAGAFWLYAEDFFRDASQEDVHEILSFLASPRHDVAFAITLPGNGQEGPQSGGGGAGAGGPPSTTPLGSKKPTAAKSSPSLAAVSLPAPAPPSTQPPDLGGDVSPPLTSPAPPSSKLNDLERRSSRLVSRLSRGNSGSRFEYIDDDTAVVDTEDEDAVLAAIEASTAPQPPPPPTAATTTTTTATIQSQSKPTQAGIAAGAATPPSIASFPFLKPLLHVPTNAQGVAVTSLWEAIPAPRLALFALQVNELIEFTGYKGSEKGLTNAEKNTATAVAAGKRSMSGTEYAAFIRWLEARCDSLTRSLHCYEEIDILSLKRKGEKSGEEKEKHNEEGEEGGDGNEGVGVGADKEKEKEREGREKKKAKKKEEETKKKATRRSQKQQQQQQPDEDGSEVNKNNEDDGDAAKNTNALRLPFSGQVHPYTKLVLETTIPAHIKLAVTEMQGIDPAGGGAGSTIRTPNNDQQQTMSMDTRAGGGGNTKSMLQDTAATSTAAGLATITTSSAAIASDDEFEDYADGGLHHEEVDEDDEDEDDDDDDGEVMTRKQKMASRSSARQRGISNYALLAGKKDPVKAAAAAAARKLNKEATAAAIASAAANHPVSRAVALAVSGAPQNVEGASADATTQWNIATSNPALLAAAPQDELAAETVALQAELASVAVANRVSLVAALRGLIEDVPNQKVVAEGRVAEEHEIVSYYSRIREEKKKELKQRREAAHREALAAANTQKGLFGHSPRPTLGLHLLTEGSDGQEVIEAPFLGPDDLYDVLAQRGEDDEAFCAVCGDGHSEAPNAIIFCDRCDVAVHQYCYDVPEVPETEWLCWPCREYEETQRQAGVPQAEIRPPHSMPDERRRLPGGARDVQCALCPIRCGAFRKTVNGQQWVHQTCALWHPECWLRPGGASTPCVVDGLHKIPPKRWTTACDICGRMEGAVINCKHPGTCHYNFHVMCARNCGLYLCVRPDFQNRPLYRIYCAIHSRGQQEKDARAAMVRVEGEHRAAVAAHDKAARAAQREHAMIQLAMREEELGVLRSIRFNMESSRVLADQCKRRERMKRQLVMLQPSLHQERLQDPQAALEFFDRLKELEVGRGMTPGQQLIEITGVGVGGGHPYEPSEALPSVSPIPLNVVQSQQVGNVQQLPSPSAAGPVATTDLGGGSGNVPSGGNDDSAGPSAKRIKLAAPAPAPPPPLPASPSSTQAAMIERQKIMSSAEANDINSKLPPKFKYVPADQLPKT